MPREWLDDAFVKRVDLRADRMEAASADSVYTPMAPGRAAVLHQSNMAPLALEAFDAAVSGAPIEWRHPYLDLRVLTFLLSVPPFPWARRKLLMREAMKDALPGEVLF